MHSLRIVKALARASFQEETAHSLNFWVGLLHSLLNLATGFAGLAILFGQIHEIHGWNYASSLALLGVYFVLGALNRLVIGSSTNTLAGLFGEVWTGQFDFTLLRPTSPRLLVSFRKWQFLALGDLVLGLVVLGVAMARLGTALTLGRIVMFGVALFIGIVILYAMMLCFASLVFWSPNFVFEWLFNSIWQMGRYPVGIYPGWLRLVLTWIVPVGLMTSVPASALTGRLPAETLAGAAAMAVALLSLANALFRTGLRRYSSASS